MTNVSRGRAAAIVTVLGALILLTTLPSWVSGTAPTATGDLPVAAAGTTASPTTASIGLVILAAGLLLGLAGRAARIGALIAVMGGGVLAAVTIIGFLREPEVVARAAAAEATSVRAINLPVTVTVWPYVAMTILVVAIGAAAWLITHLGAWASVGRRYQRAADDRPEPTRAAKKDPQVELRRQTIDDWDAISRGEDPT